MKVKELLKNPQNYTKGSFARNQDGVACDMADERASSWCVMGMMYKCYSYGTEELMEAFAKLRTAIKLKYGVSSLLIFNDLPNTTPEMLLEMAEQADV